MNITENAYCRLCAELKSRNKLTDLQTDAVAYEEIVNKLIRLNCQLDFKDNVFPKTVCLLCTNALQRAFSFVVAVDLAQIELNETITPQSKLIKKEVESSDSDNFTEVLCEKKNEIVEKLNDVDEKIDYIDIKREFETGNTNRETESSKNAINLLQTKQKNDVIDVLPLSKWKLTWNDYSWMCKYCETQFPNISELQTHSMEYHKSCNAYYCYDCNKKKLRLDSFLTHVRRHKKYLQMSCYKCCQSFPSTHETNKHRMCHISSNFICGGCNTCFSSLEELTLHMDMYYKNPKYQPVQEQQDGLTCLKCKKIFTNKTTLNTHKLIHTDRKRDHTCEICGKCFLHKQNLAAHLVLHDDKRPFQCEICKATFRTKNHLRKHVGVHDSDKPFSCEQCGKCFRLQKQLTSHSIVHTDSLPHVCSYCNKAFRFKTILNQHIRQHTGEKPYSCNICQWDFTNWPNYNKHMKRRHSMDMAKKKHTPDGVCPIDPATGQIIYPEMDKMLEWKKKIMQQKKPGRPKIKEKILKDFTDGN